MDNLEIEKYTDKSYILKGITKEYKHCLDKFKNDNNIRISWNPSVKAWLFPASQLEKIKQFVNLMKNVKHPSDCKLDENDHKKIEDKKIQQKEKKKEYMERKNQSIDSDEKPKRKISTPKEETKVVSQSEEIKKINSFCDAINTGSSIQNKKNLFKSLSQKTQETFLELSHLTKKNIRDKKAYPYKNASLILDLFNTENMKHMPAYEKIMGKQKEKEKVEYEKKYQKHPEPNTTDSTFLFYTSLYEEKSSSPLAIIWLTEHGLFNGKERESLIGKYEKISDDEKKLIR
jgi:hypothetical protein